jgi:S-adenosylmethionine:tRNA ribosyltransferase-isomerase
MRVEIFDFKLPRGLIAERPLQKRDQCRLLVLYKNGRIEHRYFYEIKDYLTDGDLVILNNTKVIPARLWGRKPTGGKIEILIVDKCGPGEYNILSRGRYSGRVLFEDGLEAEVFDGRKAVFTSEDITDYLWQHGYMPLPPYIRRAPCSEDRQWYQTVYAQKDGSIAAPTAGLHFTEELLKELGSKGVIIRYLTLHVGVGTFMPIKTENIEEHRMEEEYFEISSELIALISETKKTGRKVVAVGTTVTRVLESVFSGFLKTEVSNGVIKGKTDLYIYPGYRFKVVDALVTNFHLPRSTPLMLVSALVGRDNILNAYNEAIRKGYRFFSYGDGMLIL